MTPHEYAGWFAMMGFIFGTVTGLLLVWLFLKLLDRTLSHRADALTEED